MKISIRSSGKYIEVKITDQNIQFESGFLSVKDAEEFFDIFDQAARDLRGEIDRIKRWAKE
jgi:hypothetical protein